MPLLFTTNYIKIIISFQIDFKLLKKCIHNMATEQVFTSTRIIFKKGCYQVFII